MKKVILSLVFVLGMVNIMNANDSVKEEKEIDCIGMAFAADKEAKLSYEQFSAVVDACESAQN